ncbi:hypothetical protein [Kineococcus aurantiacus]|uniref:Uncharacterized protein n=1 Tax=Kineococcus aurantiacus TaxID=37633 RepID=A0A7Y9DPU5_9ACTN|nr:hypothetical protein [Kineococcus aurantiacus]NYD24597.1 hypothetical protein [Kineococcus aurantiacus]
MARDPLESLTADLVEHLRECFAGYSEVDVSVPTDDDQFGRWLGTPATRPAALSVGICSREALDGPLAHAVDRVRERRAVLVVCGCGREPLPGVPDHVDLVQVERASQIAGAVAEASAGDVPLVVDVRLSAEDATRLLRG